MDLGKKIHLLGYYRVGGEEVFCYFLVYDTILVHASYYGDNLVGIFLSGVFIDLPICVLVFQVFETFGHIVISIQHHYGRSFVSLLDYQTSGPAAGANVQVHGGGGEVQCCAHLCCLLSVVCTTMHLDIRTCCRSGCLDMHMYVPLLVVCLHVCTKSHMSRTACRITIAFTLSTVPHCKKDQ